MQLREKILGIVLLGGLLLWQGWPMAYRTVFGPLDELQSERDSLQSRYERKEEDQLAMLRSTKELKLYKSQSLPREPLDAQRLYQQWLTDLALSNGFQQLKVTPESRVARGTTYVAVQVSITAQATLNELTEFLVDFYQTGLLHRITRIEVTSTSQKPDAPLSVTLLAEGVCLTDAPDRDTLFPSTKLAEDISDSATSIPVLSTDDLKDLPADIQIGEERLTVTEIDEQELTVERGLAGTTAAAHLTGERIDVLPPSRVDEEAAIVAAKTIVVNQPFAKPMQYAPSFSVTGKIGVPRNDQPWTQDVSITGATPSSEAWSYRLEGESLPVGLSIDSEGKLMWSDRMSVPVGSYEVTLVAQRNSDKLETTLTLELSDAVAEQPATGDPLRETVLVGIVNRDGKLQAWFVNHVSGQRSRLAEGEELVIGDKRWTVNAIRPQEVDLDSENSTLKVKLGESLAVALKKAATQ
ncbi:Ig domain-containing protein [Calycomorphotria hydatis]|uniref:Uncharacterized protein n=1 Tax=Calycomorphotria hydatis TaxID=2528027 RepID=A0A517T5K3_9PLAN|nr:Ig domain-containing protein [Calycomorphotria hydatis]QDT63631.1 hypothetical protein V22_08550 [Calycomorphotria hydatis]